MACRPPDSNGHGQRGFSDKKQPERRPAPPQQPSKPEHPPKPATTSLMSAAIFTPFTGIPSDVNWGPTSRKEKLETIIASLDKQQKAVRQNFLTHFTRERDRIEEAAREGLQADFEAFAKASPDYHGSETSAKVWERLEEQWEKRNGAVFYAEIKEQRHEILRILRSRPNHQDVSLKGRNPPRANSLESAAAKDAEGDVKMINAVDQPPVAKTEPTVADLIREDTARKLQELIAQSVKDLEEYDGQAKVTRQYYADELAMDGLLPSEKQALVEQRAREQKERATASNQKKRKADGPHQSLVRPPLTRNGSSDTSKQPRSILSGSTLHRQQTVSAAAQSRILPSPLKRGSSTDSIGQIRKPPGRKVSIDDTPMTRPIPTGPARNRTNSDTRLASGRTDNDTRPGLDRRDSDHRRAPDRRSSDTPKAPSTMLPPPVPQQPKTSGQTTVDLSRDPRREREDRRR